MSIVRSEKWINDDMFCNLAEQYPNLTLGRVVSQEKNLYRLISSKGEYYAGVSGKFRYRAENRSDYPAVGDYVMIDHTDESNQAVIHNVLPRKSVFIRRAAGTSQTEQVVAANIDTVFLCMALNRDFNTK